MSEPSPPPPPTQTEQRQPPPPATGRTDVAGQRVDEQRGRIFPCESCGADLEFHIGQQNLKCPFCGFEKALEVDREQPIDEHPLEADLIRLERAHSLAAEKKGDEAENTDQSDERELRCDSCGGTVRFIGTLTSSKCPYCASPIQLDEAHVAKNRIAVDAVLPFQVTQKKAQSRLTDWMKTRWFAPNDFVKEGVTGKFNGVYLPYWTFDAMTATMYEGQRGDDYTVTVGSGKNRRTETRTDWTYVNGHFQRFFDDVLVLASDGLPRDMIQELEPWPLPECIPYTQEVMAGFMARTYDIELKPGFADARRRIDDYLRAEVNQRIGGDRQRIDRMHTDYDAMTYKHVMLPVWLLAYRYHDRAFRVMINATTGEVQGERPYSWVKITLAVLAGVVVAGLLMLLIGNR